MQKPEFNPQAFLLCTPCFMLCVFFFVCECFLFKKLFRAMLNLIYESMKRGLRDGCTAGKEGKKR